MKTYIAKNGTRYIKLKNGKVKFIKKSANKTKTRSRVMARKKRYSSKRRSSSMFGKLNSPLMGGVGVVAYESFISPMIPLQGTAKDLLELGAGYYLSKKKGFIGATGKSLLVINSYQLLSNLVGNKLTGIFSTSKATTGNSQSW